MKKSYGIPYSLQSSYMDMEISIKTKDNIAASPMPIRNILLILAGIISCFLLISKTFISRGTFPQKAVFCIIWIILCGLLLTSSKTKQLGLHRLISGINYMNPASRFVNTRRGSSACGFAGVAGFTHMDPDTGVLYYLDGSRGMLFDVVGNGSALLFESHKEAIIDRVDAHFRKMRPGTCYQFVTVKRPQEVDEQLESLALRQKSLTCQDDDLTAMAETERFVLSRIVGSTYKSLHQYMLLQAKNDEELKLAFNILQSEVENSTLMFRRMTVLGVPDSEKFFASIYSGMRGGE